MWLSSLAAELRPRAIVVGNLFRDQLDRYGELEAIAESWQDALRERRRAADLNADDPVVADLGRPRRRRRDPRPLYFGVQDRALALPGARPRGRRQALPPLRSPVRVRCRVPRASRPLPLRLVRAEPARARRRRPRRPPRRRAISSFTLSCGGERRRFELALPGLYNVYNALAAAALATALGVAPETIVAGLHDTRAAFGRAETLMLSPRTGSPDGEAAAARARRASC